MNSFENKTQKLICVFSQIMLYSFVVLCCQSPDSGSGSGPFWWTKLIGSQWCSSPPQFNPRWTLYGPRSWVTGYDKHLDSNICDVVEICVPTSTHLVYKSFQKSLKQLVTVFIRKKARSIFSSGLIHIYCCRLDQVKIMCSVCVCSHAGETSLMWCPFSSLGSPSSAGVQSPRWCAWGGW